MMTTPAKLRKKQPCIVLFYVRNYLLGSEMSLKQNCFIPQCQFYDHLLMNTQKNLKSVLTKTRGSKIRCDERDEQCGNMKLMIMFA